MRLVLLLLLAAGLGGVGGCAAVAAVPAKVVVPEGYKLVWHDEFERAGALNDADWGYEEGFVRNNELQWYQRENAVCKDGFLVIEARKESRPNPRFNGAAAGGGGGRGNAWATPFASRPTIEVTAASVNTRNKHSWLYGKFEMRARINVSSGSWPAFWALGIQGGWPANGEIDIMEFYRSTLLFNVAWGGANGAVWNDVRKPMAQMPAGWEKEFHVWRMDWDEKFIKLYLDDVLMNTQDLTATVNVSRGGRAGRGAAALENPFRGPAYLLVNQAIGGDNGGDPAKSEFPMRYEVDYVRVFQTPAQEAATTEAMQRFEAARGRGRGGPATGPTTLPGRGG